MLWLLINPFIPDCLKWVLFSLNLDTFAYINGCHLQIKNRVANSTNPDEKAPYKPSHLDLHYLHRKLVWSAAGRS